MYLKRIELQGFKSFPDRTVLDFDTGITAILGPNGCGKSNVVDAVKWVLGEMSPKNLRGSEMQDVIFAGSERRKPVGRAEVTLVFDNQLGTLPLDFNEVAITRRLHRSGESEYLINRQACRRRDIRELFLDTGVGTSAYSVIEQGRVEELLAAKPQERRLVFEEAAGISRYKTRRKETLSRLERTRQYGLRVNDIVEEVERSVRRVARQAAAARRFRRHEAALLELRTERAAREFRHRTAERDRLAEERRGIDQLYAQESARAAESARTIAGLTSREMDLAEQHEAREGELRSLQDDLAAVQADRSAAAERAAGLERERVEADRRAAALRERLEALAGEIDTAGASLDETRGEAEAAREALAGAEEAVRALGEADADAERVLETRRAQAETLAARRAGLQEKAARVESEEAGLRQQAEQMAARAAPLRRDREAAARAAGELEAEAARAHRERARAGADLADARRVLTARTQAHERIEARLRAIADRTGALAARLQTLEDLHASFEGTYQGVRATLEAEPPGVRGMVADLVDVPEAYVTAIETLLGSHAQDIVTDTARDAQACIEHLRQTRSGRATFLPLDRIRPRRDLAPDLGRLPGVLGEALDLVGFDDALRPAMAYLLGGALVVESLEHARELAGGPARGVLLVTLEGDLINPYGAMTGGQGKRQRGGLVARRAEMERLRQDLARHADETESLRRERVQTWRLLDEIRRVRDDLALRHDALDEATRTAAGELARQEETRRRLDEEIARLEAELGAARNSAADAAGRWAALATQVLTVKEEILANTHALEAARAERGAAREALSGKNAELAPLREAAAEAARRLAGLEERCRALRQDRDERARELEERTAFLRESDAETRAVAERAEALRAKEGDLLESREALRRAEASAREELASVRERLREERETERAGQKRIAEVSQAQHELSLKENEVRLRLEALLEKARDELGIPDLAACIPAADRRAAGEEDGVAAAAAAQDEGDDGEADGEDRRNLTLAELAELADEELAERIRQTQGKIERIGPVNLNAIEELTELETRAEFLRAEQEDLRQAEEDLREVIDRLNTECERRFAETFAAVRDNFQELFRKLFGGGRADLVLEETEEGDPLEAGIEIIARPPGKEPKSISLLSGGEKALCAVALLFAIFRSKPSPFCILDEVDGPLDESNIDRFMQAVREFAEETQFILISHNKRTMSMTDTIYGVTQDEPGVSTKYSLRFRDAYEELNRDGTGADASAPEPEPAMAG
jgi:chromosome segregation protein